MSEVFGAKRTHIALRVLAVVYLAGVWLDGVGNTSIGKVLPRAVVYFFQVSVLFPLAALTTIDYRAEGWVCSERRWVELDTTPYFPIDAHTKENRFNRVMHFARENHKVMAALDEYLVHRYSGDHDLPIGGVRLMSLRIPIPKVGSHVEPYARRPLAEYPEEQRKRFYATPKSKRTERCGVRVDSE